MFSTPSRGGRRIEGVPVSATLSSTSVPPAGTAGRGSAAAMAVDQIDLAVLEQAADMEVIAQLVGVQGLGGGGGR